MIKLHWTSFIMIVLGLSLISAILSHSATNEQLAKDCATLNQTVINGQWVMCRPHDAKPRDIL